MRRAAGKSRTAPPKNLPCRASKPPRQDAAARCCGGITARMPSGGALLDAGLHRLDHFEIG
ncbi:MAG: hypothetical protein MZV49_00420 [Rhodopseudomonas palustris]|nr:hypothetical protein [Rhodopseudomonas palustris]